MKKISFLLLAVLLCLLLTACGKTEAVKNLESQIAAIEEVTPESGDMLLAIEEAYSALTEEERKTVGNYEAFLAHENAYDELSLTGTWYPYSLSLWHPDSIFTPRYSLTLNADMTCVYRSGNPEDRAEAYGEWKAENGEIVISGINSINTENWGWSHGDNPFSMRIDRSEGSARLWMHDQVMYVREEDYLSLLDGVILRVDCAAEELNDALSFHAVKRVVYDEWGVHTGQDYTRACLKNNLYEDGWYYIGTSADFAIEICYPEYTETFAYNDGGVHTKTIEAGAYTLTRDPFLSHEVPLNFAWTTTNGTIETTLAPEDLSIGRAKGYIYYVNAAYVEEVFENEHGQRELRLTEEAKSFLNENCSTGFWEAENNEY